MDAILHDADSCEFLMVAAPTDLSLAETGDLYAALRKDGIKGDVVLVNGLLDAQNDAALATFSDNLKRTQAAALADLGKLADDLDLDLVTAPQFDGDLDGKDGLDALADALFADR